MFDLALYIAKQQEWSVRTFGPGRRLGGILSHIRKELKEIKASPSDLAEWIDVVILALDGAWRAGYTPLGITQQLKRTQKHNIERRWPDWRQYGQDQAIEHDRTDEPHARLLQATKEFIAAANRHHPQACRGCCARAPQSCKLLEKAEDTWCAFCVTKAAFEVLEEHVETIERAGA